MEASASSSWPGLPYVDSENVQLQYLQASSQTKPVFGSLSTSPACVGWDVSFVDTCTESRHNVLTEEPNNGTSLGGSTDNGTGINIVYRQRPHAANTNSLVGASQGLASRRIRLQISGQPIFSMANEFCSDMGHNEDDASVSMGETVEDITVVSGSGPGYYNLEKIQHFSDDDCTHDEPPNSAILHLAEEFQNKARLLDSDVCGETRHVSILRRPKPKQNDARDDIRKGGSLQLGRSVKTSFLSVNVALMDIFIILSLLFVGIWKGL